MRQETERPSAAKSAGDCTAEGEELGIEGNVAAGIVIRNRLLARFGSGQEGIRAVAVIPCCRDDVRIGTPLQRIGLACRSPDQAVAAPLAGLHADTMRMSIGEDVVQRLVVAEALRTRAVGQPAVDVV